MRWRSVELQALIVEVMEWLKPFMSRLVMTGAVRRLEETVTEVELLAVPNDCDALLEAILSAGFDERVQPDISKFGAPPSVVRFVHLSSGVPFCVHLVQREAWWTELVYTTGPASFWTSLTRHALREAHVLKRGGLRRELGALRRPTQERSVFRMVNHPYVLPEARH